jgi:hypothetical protein
LLRFSCDLFHKPSCSTFLTRVNNWEVTTEHQTKAIKYNPNQTTSLKYFQDLTLSGWGVVYTQAALQSPDKALDSAWVLDQSLIPHRDPATPPTTITIIITTIINTILILFLSYGALFSALPAVFTEPGILNDVYVSTSIWMHTIGLTSLKEKDVDSKAKANRPRMSPKPLLSESV